MWETSALENGRSTAHICKMAQRYRPRLLEVRVIPLKPDQWEWQVLSPFSEYAPTKPATTIKLIHYRRLGAKPHESSASDGYLGIQCLQRFQGLDATRNWDCRYPAQRAAPPGVNRGASPCPSEVTRPSNSPPKSSPCWALPHSSPLHPH